MKRTYNLDRERFLLSPLRVNDFAHCTTRFYAILVIGDQDEMKGGLVATAIPINMIDKHIDPTMLFYVALSV